MTATQEKQPWKKCGGRTDRNLTLAAALVDDSRTAQTRTERRQTLCQRGHNPDVARECPAESPRVSVQGASSLLLACSLLRTLILLLSGGNRPPRDATCWWNVSL